MKITPKSDLVFKYLALPNGLGGRGGVQRFFLLSQGIPFEEKLYGMGDEWATEKARMKSSGENPSATAPVIYADDIPLPQHIATSRLLSTIHGCNASDPYGNYVQDLVADEYQGFRDSWVHMAFSGTDDEKAAWKATGLPDQLDKFNALYQQFKTTDNSTSPFLSLSAKTQQPLWGDAAIFGLVRDNILTGFLSRDELAQYPYLQAMVAKYETIPAVADWIDTKMKSLAA
mmetsp:Transcript_33460/g.69660  ORF Transcript_33460/g.69660 Transcript_33460/m.69660 type:complete len:230 (-) Transcript_33460:101-790(-)|eukprot:CAMPEP_0172453796 /NCGR_PEP_ID=MMETSP1065-20121228/10972_1 /TAXON_ID=265537 /ORGANISM="Amphiprora paludosa, Strain CCMP125" /LENGTH=229 /DNA_ID=CAMNT_0013206011 /DNA_START=315 /DNA_END=1004 /DNA_ORIENTATION=+